MTVGADLPLGAESGTAGEVVPVVPNTNPTCAEMSLPLPTAYESMLSGTAAETPCTGAFCESSTVDVLAAVTIGLVLGYVLIAGTVRLVCLLWTVAWRGTGLLRHALSEGLEMIARAVWRARSDASSGKQETGH